MTKILVIEDEPELRKAYSTLLRLYNYDFEIAENGERGIDMIASYIPDIILLDMLMPKMDGVEFLQKANVAENLPNTYVLLFSNMSNGTDKEQLAALGVDEILLKADYGPAELKQKIEEIEKKH